MNNQLTPFVFDEALFRVQKDEQGELWFVAKDVCNILDLDSSNISRQGYLDDDEKGLCSIQTLGGFQGMLTVSESGFYSLVFRSRKPEAHRFRKWVTSEVLPAIRKAGTYVALPIQLELPEFARRLKSSVRANVLSATIQAARLTNLCTTGEIDALFLHYCQLIGEGSAMHLAGIKAGSVQEEKGILRFAEQKLATAKGERIGVADLYRVLAAWWQVSQDAPLPTLKRFAAVVGSLYPRFKRGGRYYFYDVTELKPDLNREI